MKLVIKTYGGTNSDGWVMRAQVRSVVNSMAGLPFNTYMALLYGSPAVLVQPGDYDNLLYEQLE
jgi:hypothetical protein